MEGGGIGRGEEEGREGETDRETERQRDTSVMKLCSLAQIYAAFLGKLSAGEHE